MSKMSNEHVRQCEANGGVDPNDIDIDSGAPQARTRGETMNATVLDILEVGPVNEVVTVVSRMQDFLPEYAKTKADEVFHGHWKAVEELERELASRRVQMRTAARAIFKKVRQNWNNEEIEAATGYRAK